MGAATRAGLSGAAGHHDGDGCVRRGGGGGEEDGFKVALGQTQADGSGVTAESGKEERALQRDGRGLGLRGGLGGKGVLTEYD